MHMYRAYGGQKRASDALELELMKVVCLLMWVLGTMSPPWRNNNCAELLSLLSSPNCTFLQKSSLSSDVLGLENQKHKASKTQWNRKDFSTQIPSGSTWLRSISSRRGHIFCIDIFLEFRRQACVLWAPCLYEMLLKVFREMVSLEKESKRRISFS